MHFDWFDYTHHKYAQYKQKGFSLVLIIIIVLIALVVLSVPLPGYRSMEVCTESDPPVCLAKGWYFNTPVYQQLFFAGQTAQQSIPPTPLPSVTSAKESDSTANWKTYTTKYLSFKYPQDWIQPFNIKDVGCIILNPPEKKDGEPTIDLIICPPILYLMDPRDETFNKSPERLANDATSSSRIKEGLMLIIKRENIVLDKHNAIRLEFQSRDKDIKEIDVYVDKVLFPPGSDGERPLQSVLGILEITYGILDPSKMEYAENTFDQILSTFKFLDQDNTCTQASDCLQGLVCVGRGPANPSQETPGVCVTSKASQVTQ